MGNPKRPKDTNQRAKLIVELATGERVEPTGLNGHEKKNPNAVALGRLGGLKGGKARAKSLTKKERVAIAKKGAKKRWG